MENKLADLMGVLEAQMEFDYYFDEEVTLETLKELTNGKGEDEPNE